MTKFQQKKHLIILSDMWGFESAEWLKFYIENLQNHFKIALYDTRKLALTPQTTVDEELLHQHFINIGMDHAVRNLLSYNLKDVIILAFSIGGTVAWKALLQGLPNSTLFAISSTRLRMEVQKPHAEINLLFGELDCNKPTSEWFTKLNINQVFVEKQHHEMYKIKEVADRLCQLIIE